VSALFTLVWWKAAGLRAARTAVVIAIPYLPASYTGHVPYIALASAAVLGAILSLLFSLAGVAEAKGEVHPFWYSVAERVLKTIAQALIAGIGTSLFVTDVDWTSLGNIALTSGFGSLLLALLAGLPESTTSAGVPLTPAQVAAEIAAEDTTTAPAAEPTLSIPAPAPAVAAEPAAVEEPVVGEPIEAGEPLIAQ
jgi:hypothetical protein